MTYHYICDKCKKVTDIEVPMGNDLPKGVHCEKCSEGILKHDFMNQVKSQVVEIPHSFRAISPYSPRIKYKKDATMESLE